eukprot:gene11332-13214_t
MEVIYTGLRQTPEMVVNTALQEDVDAIGISILSGAHMTVFPKIMDVMKEKGLSNVLLTGGGIIPEKDMLQLKEKGVGTLFAPGTTMATINILSELQGQILKVTINREQKLNALNKATLAELAQVIAFAAERDEVKAVLLTGAGEKAFVAGADISEFSDFNGAQGEELAANGQNTVAERALTIGLVNHVVEPQELIPKSLEMLEKIKQRAPLALAAAIKAVNASGTGKSGFETEIREFGNCFNTFDFKEGVSAFLEKRKPVFGGK